MTTVTLTEKFLAETISPLVTKSFSELQSFTREIGKPVNLSGEAGTTSRLLEELNLVLGSLRTLNEQQLAGLLKKAGRLERYWKSPFLQQPGAVNSTFGERLNYTFGGKPIGALMQSGYSFIMPRGSKVIAAADGVVIFSETLGTLGRVIGIDHGLGLVSIYGQLEAPLSQEGDLVSAGQPIAISGSSGFARNNGAYFELRVHGVPVDPREWWDRSWFFGHVVEQIQAAKKLLEIPFEPVTEESF
jgi:murein DD-endopeptidase MepM/ murein hydrolase activator NlpD